MSLDLWEKRYPDLARDLLREIARKCRRGVALDDEERAYLVEAIGRWLERGMSAERAFYLVGEPGARSMQGSLRNAAIYNRVEDLRRARPRTTLAGIYALVASDGATKRGGKGKLSPEAVKKIHLDMKRVRAKAKNRAGE